MYNYSNRTVYLKAEYRFKELLWLLHNSVYLKQLLCPIYSSIHTEAEITSMLAYFIAIQILLPIMHRWWDSYIILMRKGHCCHSPLHAYQRRWDIQVSFRLTFCMLLGYSFCT